MKNSKKCNNLLVFCFRKKKPVTFAHACCNFDCTFLTLRQISDFSVDEVSWFKNLFWRIFLQIHVFVRQTFIRIWNSNFRNDIIVEQNSGHSESLMSKFFVRGCSCKFMCMCCVRNIHSTLKPKLQKRHHC